MTAVRVFLLFATVGIYLFTAAAIASSGPNWPAVAVSDLVALNWRSQFDFDLIIHLVLLATWISWREGFSLKGQLFGVLSIVMGGMFSFPYLLYAIYVAKGNPSAVVLGVNRRN